MNVLQAFKILGLDSPMDFLWSTPDGSTRRLGATTHMLVAAAVDVVNGKDVLIVGHNMGYSETLGKDCARLVLKLVPGADIIRKVDRSFRFGSGFGVIYFESVRTRVKFLAEKPGMNEYSDHVWALDAARARMGPYQAIREIRLENGSYQGYTAAGERLDIELTKEGSEALVASDPFRVRIIR